MKNDSKTTVLGLLTAALNLYANGLKPSQIALSLAIATLGKMAADTAKEQK